MKALTVQQPWAWAIIHGGKDIENRTQAWGYRGPLAIHAGNRFSDRGGRSPHILMHEDYADAELVKGAIIGVVDLVDVHPADPRGVCDCSSTHPDHHSIGCSVSNLCCESDWAESSYLEHDGNGGRTRRDIVHLVLENPRPLAEPIPCRGSLGLWTPSTEVLDDLEVAIA